MGTASPVPLFEMRLFAINVVSLIVHTLRFVVILGTTDDSFFAVKEMAAFDVEMGCYDRNRPPGMCIQIMRPCSSRSI
jgi:hypothetical protein